MSNANNSIRSAVTLPSAIPVLDPMCKAGFIHVPMHLTAPTKGRSDWTEAAGVLMRDLSVCCLFQNNRCRAGTGCRQIHCDRTFIAQERQKQMGVVSCCLACRDSMTLANLESAPATSAFATAVRREASVRFTGAAAVGMPILPIRSFALTSGLQPYVQKAGAVIEVPWTAVCRLHLKDQCKFGRDCKNVHACTLLGKNLLSTAAVTVNQSVSPSILETAAATPLRQPAAASAPPQPPQTPTIVPPRAMSVSAESFFAERQQSWAAANASAESVPTPSAASPAPIAPIADLATFRQPRAPAQFRASFPRLDEGSLQLRDADLDGLIFNLPTLHSALSNDSYACNEFSDLFGLASPAFAGGASPLASLLLGPIGSGAGMIPASSPVSPAQRGCSVRLR